MCDELGPIEARLDILIAVQAAYYFVSKFNTLFEERVGISHNIISHDKRILHCHVIHGSNLTERHIDASTIIAKLYNLLI